MLVAATGACGSEEPTTEDPAPIADGSDRGGSDGGGEETEPSDGGGTEPSEVEDPTTEPGPDDESPDDESAEPTEDQPTDAGPSHTRVLFVANIDGEVQNPSSGQDPDAEPASVDGTTLSSNLGNNLGDEGSEASCDGGLTWAEGDSQTCLSAASEEGSESPATWIALPARVADGESPHEALLYTVGPEPSEDAQEALTDGWVTGLGFGTMYGQEGPIGAADLNEDVVQVLNSENAYVDVPGTAEEVSCEDDLDFETFEPVECESTWSDGGSFALEVLPGDFVGNDAGLIVVIDDGD
jgi:hypothetical protein